MGKIIKNEIIKYMKENTRRKKKKSKSESPRINQKETEERDGEINEK